MSTMMNRLSQTLRPLCQVGLAASLAVLAGCNQPINLFSIQDDIDLGSQLRDEINSNPAEYPVMDPAAFPEAYGHLDRIRDEILASGQVTYADDFAWETYLIHDDATLNAFAAPGGYIYVYTGLLRFLDEEDHFAGVLGHEIAHADRRHSTNQLTKAYGVSVLLGVVFGDDPGLIPEIAAGLASMGFSRADESDADDQSVLYLCETQYAANGAAGFFEKLEAEGAGSIPEFLSTHPSGENRIADINLAAEDRGCATEIATPSLYSDFLNSLP